MTTERIETIWAKNSVWKVIEINKKNIIVRILYKKNTKKLSRIKAIKELLKSLGEK